MRMCCVLVCLPHELTRTMKKIQNYRVSFFLNTLIEELRVVKGLITLAARESVSSALVLCIEYSSSSILVLKDIVL